MTADDVELAKAFLPVPSHRASISRDPFYDMLATRKRRIANKKWWVSTRNCTCIATMSATSVLVCVRVCVCVCVAGQHGGLTFVHSGVGDSRHKWEFFPHGNGPGLFSTCLHLNSPVAWRFLFWIWHTLWTLTLYLGVTWWRGEEIWTKLDDNKRMRAMRKTKHSITRLWRDCPLLDT